MDADCVEGDECGVDDGAEEGVEDGADKHDAFYQEQEEGEDGDYDVEVCDAAGCNVSSSSRKKGLDKWEKGRGDYN